MANSFITESSSSLNASESVESSVEISAGSFSGLFSKFSNSNEGNEREAQIKSPTSTAPTTTSILKNSNNNSESKLHKNVSKILMNSLRTPENGAAVSMTKSMESNTTGSASQQRGVVRNNVISPTGSETSKISKEGIGSPRNGLYSENRSADSTDIENSGSDSIGDNTDYSENFDRDVTYYKPGDLTCWCKPRAVSGFVDWASRTGYWTVVNRHQILSGIVVAFGQCPEVISYALMVGINPLMALHTTWIMGIITSILGGRPGMINGPTGAVTIALANLIRNDGVEYIFYAVIFAGLLEMVFAAMRMGMLIRLIPHPILVGFVNSMAVIIAISQVRHFKVFNDVAEGRSSAFGYHGNFYKVLVDDTPWVDGATAIVMSIEASMALIICVLLPKITRVIPGTFVAIVVVTCIEWIIGRNVGYATPVIGNFGEFQSYPMPIFLDNSINLPPINYDTWAKIWPTGLAVFAVSLVESLLTFKLVGDITETRGEVNLMTAGQGLAQVVSSILGGMGGGTMLAQSVINTRSDGVTRLSSFVAGLTVLLLLVGAYPVVSIIPMAAVVGVMIYAAFELIQWTSFITLLAAIFPQSLRDMLYLDCKVNRFDTLVMILVMFFTLFFDLAIAVGVGVFISASVHCWDSSKQLVIEREESDEEDAVTYVIRGPLFFATSTILLESFSRESIMSDPKDVVLLLEHAEVFDWSGMIALKMFHDVFASCGKLVALSTITPTTKNLMEKNSSMWEGVIFLELQELDRGVSQSASMESKIDEEEIF